MSVMAILRLNVVVVIVEKLYRRVVRERREEWYSQIIKKNQHCRIPEYPEKGWNYKPSCGGNNTF